MDEQVNDNVEAMEDAVPEGVVEEQYVEEQVEEQVQEEPQQQEDWRVQALRNDPSVRARFDEALFGAQQQEAAPMQVDPVAEAQAKLNELDASMPSLDEKNITAQSVTQFMTWQQERARAAQAVYDARLEQQQNVILQQQSRTVLEDYMQQARSSDPDFRSYESEFRQYVQQNSIDPRLLQNRTVVEMIRKAIGYDHIRSKRRTRAPGAPAVNEAYTQQGQQSRQRQQSQQQLRAATELDQQLAAFYRMPVEDLIRNEGEMDGDREHWTMKGAVQWSKPEKLRRAGFRR